MQAIRFPNRGAGNHIDWNIEFMDHTPNHGQLLGVLLSEVCPVRLGLAEEFEHDRGHATKVPRSRSPFEDI